MVKRHQWKNQFKQLPNQSNFHEKVRLLLQKHPILKRFNCYQEINVTEIIPTYEFYNHHYDWYIEDLGVVLELHGQQHYKVVNYGNLSYDEAQRNFYRMKDRDNSKKTAAENQGFKYVEIPYNEYNKLDQSVLDRYLFGE